MHPIVRGGGAFDQKGMKLSLVFATVKCRVHQNGEGGGWTSENFIMLFPFLVRFNTELNSLSCEPSVEFIFIPYKC